MTKQTFRQQVLGIFPKAYCFSLCEKKAYQIALPTGDGCSIGISKILSTPKLAWKSALEDWCGVDELTQTQNEIL